MEKRNIEVFFFFSESRKMLRKEGKEIERERKKQVRGRGREIAWERDRAGEREIERERKERYIEKERDRRK